MRISTIGVVFGARRIYGVPPSLCQDRMIFERTEEHPGARFLFILACLVVVVYGLKAAGKGFRLDANSHGDFEAYIYGDDDDDTLELDSDISISDGKWHHVAGTFDGEHMNLYVDGKQVGSKAIVGKLNTESTQPMKVGSYGGEPFYGDLNDIRQYRSGLSKIQIERIAGGDQQVAEDTMVGSWKREEDVKPIISTLEVRY